MTSPSSMSGIRPRQSIVNLFDPLANSAASETPSTPHHDASNTDKETFKDSPNGLTMTLFVNKLSEAVSHPQPPPLKRRLIDIGDMTLEDAASPEALLDEDVEEEFSAGFSLADDEDNATLTFKDMVKAATPNRSLKPIFESPIGRALPMAQLSPADTTGMEVTSIPPSDNGIEGLKPGALFNESILEEDEAEVPAVVPQQIDTPAPEQNSSIAPEDVPLPPSPLVSTRELAADCVGEPISDAGFSFEAHPDLNLSPNAADKPAYTSTPCDRQSVDQDQSVSQDHPSISSLSIESSENLLADTSIPVIVSISSRPPSTTPPDESEHSFDEKNVQSRLRPSIASSPQDCNRFSVDLTTSFQLHMQSTDLSFDLLNDKMSLFNTQIDMESFLATTEDDSSFNLEAEKANVDKALKKPGGDVMKRERVSSMDDISSATSSSAPATPVDVPSTPFIPTDGSDVSPVPFGSKSKATRKRLSIPISTSSFRLVDTSPPSAGTTFLPTSPSNPFSPSNGSKLRNPVECSPMVPTRSVEKRRNTLQLATPKTFEKPTAPVMPPAVPALKFLKRTRTIDHERSDSTSIPGHSNSKTATGLKRLSIATSSKLQNLSSTAPLRTRKPTTELDNPQEKDMHVQPAGQATKAKPFVAPRPTISSQPTSGPGPRRVPVSEGPQLKSTTSRTATIPSAPTGGPKRAIASTATTPHARSGSISTSSGMKPPIRVGTTNTSSATSSLPKPTPRASTSRLPAPKSLKLGGLPTLRRAT